MNFQFAKGLMTGRLEALAAAATDNLKDLVGKVQESFKTLCDQVDDQEDVDDAETETPKKKRGPKKRDAQHAKIDVPGIDGCKDLKEALSLIMPLCGGSINGMSNAAGVGIETFQRIIRDGKKSVRSDARAKLQAAFGIPDKLFDNPAQELKP